MAGPRGVVVKEALMAAETCAVAVDWRPETYALLWDPVNHCPRDLWALIYDDPVAGTLMCPPLGLFAVDGDELGLVLGGVGILHALGSGGIGPTEVDKEYLSGANKLGNPLDPANPLDPPDLYWSVGDTVWVVGAGFATTSSVVDNTTDQAFVCDEKFPVTVGATYGAACLVGRVPGYSLGRIRLRKTFYGKFTHPNLFPLIADGAWDEQVTNNPDAAGPAFEVVGGVLRARTSFPIRQLVLNPLFADGFDHWFTDLPPGFGATQWVADGSAAPDLPTSVHYEGSGFVTADVVITDASDTITSATADWTSPSAVGMLVEGPDIPPYTYVLAVSAPGTAQMSALATADHLAGDQTVAFRPQSTSRTYLCTDAENAATTLSHYPVAKGEVWSLYCHVMKTANANGTATVNFAKVKTATADHLAGVFLEQADSISTGGALMLSTLVESNVRVVIKQTTIEEETTNLGVLIELAGNTDGRWWFSNFLLQRMWGNKDWIEAAAPIAVTPERTYEFRIPVTFRPDEVREAAVRLLVRLSGPGRADIVLTSSDRTPYDKPAGADDGHVVLSVTPPSGYHTATPELMIQDVLNGYATFGEMTVVDTDDSTMVFDAVSASDTAPVNVPLIIFSVAPAGATDVSLSAVVEANGIGWAASTFGLSRSTDDPATGADVIADVLTDPTTGDPLAIAAGTITAPAAIPYDWRVIRMDRRSQLDHLCAVVSEPVLEYHVNADVAPTTIDVGPADVVFATHPLASAILPSDLEVETLSNPDTDTSDRPTEITVVGNDRQTVSGRPIPITATAQVPGPVKLDINGRPVVRTQTIPDGTVDHRQYAQALADDMALRASEPPVLVTVKLSGKNARADVPPGDTIHVYRPEAGLTAYPDNAVTIEGRQAYPRAVRVLERERTLGPSHRIVMLRPDGTTFPLEGVRPSEEDAVVLTVGDRLPEWLADPQGGSAGKQYLRDRMSRPR